MKDSRISQIGSNRTFTIIFESLGEPSCALVYFTVGSISSKQVTYGSNAFYCSLQYPSTPFMGIYNIYNNSLTFDLLMYLNGTANVYFNIKNSIDKSTTTTRVTVSNLNCKIPILVRKHCRMIVHFAK